MAALAAAYALLGRVAEPLLPALLRARARRGKEDTARLPERLGHASLPRPASRLIWLHAASVGESLSLLPLIAALQAARPDVAILMTTGTVTSARLMAERLPEGAVHQFFPLDAPGPIGRFLDHWRPDLAVFCESELWPGWLGALSARGVPTALINARMSDRSWVRWRKAGGIARHLLAGFSVRLAQSDEDAQRLRDLGAGEVFVPGNLKDAAPPLPVQAEALAAWNEATAGRVQWLAASTHPGEDELVLDAHQALATGAESLLTVIVPRHPERGAAIQALAESRGFPVSRRSTGALPRQGDAVHVADTLGELGLFYRSARVALVGGSLVPHGGQNPLEPARLRCPILVGPHTWNFKAAISRLRDAGGLREVVDAPALAAEAARLLDDEPARAALADRAFAAVQAAEAVVPQTVAALLGLIESRAPSA